FASTLVRRVALGRIRPRHGSEPPVLYGLEPDLPGRRSRLPPGAEHPPQPGIALRPVFRDGAQFFLRAASSTRRTLAAPRAAAARRCASRPAGRLDEARGGGR